jgi:hypothetical protein
MESGKQKNYQDWLFDLEEYMAEQVLGARIEDFSRAALLHGFMNNLCPEEFLKNDCNSLHQQVSDIAKGEFGNTSSVPEPAPKLRKKPSPILFITAGAILLVILAVAVPRLLNRADRVLSGGVLGTSQAQIASARLALEAVEALASVTKSGVNFKDYSERVAEAQIAVDRYENEFGKQDAFSIAVENALAHYRFANDFWDKAVTENDEYIHSRSRFWKDFLSQYPEEKVLRDGESSGELIVVEGDMYSVKNALSLIWIKARTTVELARRSLPR